MSISYNMLTEAFLDKISEFKFLYMNEGDAEATVDRYMRRTISTFDRICTYDLLKNMDHITREIYVDVKDEDIDEIVDIISEGMVTQWMKPYVYRQENLENVLNTRDFTTYSPAELLLRIGNAYEKSQSDYTQMVREYSYNHGDLSDLHL